jgi:hypothetical protein
METNGSGVSALLGLDGFVVLAQLLDDVTDEWWLKVETTDIRGWCPTVATIVATKRETPKPKKKILRTHVKESPGRSPSPQRCARQLRSVEWWAF